MEHRQKLYAAKTVSWPGATPFFPPVCGPNPLRGFGGHARPRCTRSTRAFGVLPRTSIQYPDSNRARASLHHSRPLQTRAAPELFRQGDQRYQEHLFDQMYQDWATKGFSPTEVKALVDASPEQPKMACKTHLLPESYDILDHVSVRKNRHGSGTLRGNALSTNDSAPSSTSGTRKYLQAQEQTHEQHLQYGRGKKPFVAGSDPHFWREYHAKIPSGFGGRSRPQCVRLAHELPTYPASAVPKVPARADRRCSLHDPESNRGERPMPLLKPPEPVIAERRYFARIEEPLALTMEHDTESLGTPTGTR